MEAEEIAYFQNLRKQSEHDSRERVFREFADNFRRIRKRKHREAICLLTRILAAVDNGQHTDALKLDGTSQTGGAGGQARDCD
jgi:hypothetical protein